ncbi:MAG: efflux RND transporter permease subunit [Firmicutes bacterium]|nr:efflux RND transporter permease subunit [Bacillota bacterium]
MAGLLVTRQPLSVTALIGVLMLIGIVMNNAIVLVNYINRLRRQTVETDEAIARAGPIRLHPILMTALATVLALVPLAVAGGEGSELLRGLAIVVGFGLILSTLVTLLLVPVVYQRFDRLGSFLRHRHRTSPSSQPPVTPLCQDLPFACETIILRSTGGKRKGGLQHGDHNLCLPQMWGRARGRGGKRPNLLWCPDGTQRGVNQSPHCGSKRRTQRMKGPTR